MEAKTALITKRRRSKIRIARVDRRAAGQRHMGERWTTVILQSTKQRISIDLIARAIQKAAAVVTAEIVSMRGNCTAVVEDVSARYACVEDGISDLNHPSELIRRVVETAAEVR